MKDGKFFKLGETKLMWKWLNQFVASVGQRKIWVPDRIQTYDPPNTGRALYPLEVRGTEQNSWRAHEAIY